MSTSADNAIVRGLELAASAAATSRRLREALTAGEPTAAIRQEIAELNDAITQLAADQAQQAAAKEAHQAEQIAAGAEVLIADAKARVDTLMASLAIPPAPVPCQGPTP